MPINVEFNLYCRALILFPDSCLPFPFLGEPLGVIIVLIMGNCIKCFNKVAKRIIVTYGDKYYYL